MPRPIFAVCVAGVLSAAPPAAAQTVPQLTDVSGVSADDVLNIRAEPSADSAIVGTLAPDRTRVEVLNTDASGRWGRIGRGEGAGWVAMAYLTPRDIGSEGMPAGMRCLGTEPFWSLTFEGGLAAFATPDEEVQVPFAADRLIAAPENPLYGWASTDERGTLSGTIRAAACSDGMSDRPFGWQTGLVRQRDGEVGVLSGCCTLGAD